VTNHSVVEGAGGASVPEAPSTGRPTLCMINYNGERFLASSLRSAVAQRERFAELVLIDDASEDGSLEMVRREFPSVRIVQLPENRGPAAARNVALKEARTDHVLMIDNDICLAPHCVDRLSAALAARPDAVVAAPAVLYVRRPDVVQYDGADNHFLGLMSLHHENWPIAAVDTDVRRVGSVITACFLVDRSRLPEDAAFDESFFIYLEDHDFGVRVRALGYDLLSVPAAHCYHGEGTEGLSIRQLGRYSKRRVFLLIRNRWQFLLKNYSLRTLLLLAPLMLVYELAQLVVVLKKGWAREWYHALRWVVRHWPDIREKRRRVQYTRKTPDRALLSNGPIPFRDELTAGRMERVGRQMLDVAASWYWKCVAQFI
jgi:GT2 family glycosyltransferase